VNASPPAQEQKDQQTHFINSAKARASSTPGIAKAKSCIMLCIPESAVEESKGKVFLESERTLVDHFLDRSRRVDFHGVQVVIAIDLGRFLAKLLAVSV
jgi:hypothetical protein